MVVAGKVVPYDLINVGTVIFCSEIAQYVYKKLDLLQCYCFHLEIDEVFVRIYN